MHITAKKGHVLVNNLKVLANFGVEARKMVEPLENFRCEGFQFIHTVSTDTLTSRFNGPSPNKPATRSPAYQLELRTKVEAVWARPR